MDSVLGILWPKIEKWWGGYRFRAEHKGKPGWYVSSDQETWLFIYDDMAHLWQFTLPNPWEVDRG